MKKSMLGIAAVVVVLAAAMAAPASAAPTIIRETVTTPVHETELTDDCRPGLTGTLNGTDVFSFQSVETAHSFHFRGREGGPGRIDWSDGSYTLLDSVDRFSFNAAKGQHQVFTETHVDSGDFYSPAGVFEFGVTFHEVEHFTVTADGAVRVEVERGHFHGGC
jgi:hypothetical protein